MVKSSRLGGSCASMMISSVKAKKMLRKGCTEYLAHMMNKVDESVSSFQNAFIIVKF